MAVPGCWRMSKSASGHQVGPDYAESGAESADKPGPERAASEWIHDRKASTGGRLPCRAG